MTGRYPSTHHHYLPPIAPRVFSRRRGAPRPPDGEPWVYVGRPSPWGNPYPLSFRGVGGDPIEQFREYLRRSPRLVARIRTELAGKHLVCWCAPKPCHADVLLRVAAGGEP